MSKQLLLAIILTQAPATLVHEIRSTGESLFDAKSKALAETAAYLASLPEVQKLQLSKDELAAYAMGLARMEELDRATSQVVVRIDPAAVVPRLQGLRKNRVMSSELFELHKQALEMQQEETASKWDARRLVAQATVVLSESEGAAPGSHAAGEREQARRFADHALALDRDYGEAHLRLADVLRQEGRFAEAEREYRRGLTRSPNSATGHNALGLVLSALQREAQALPEFLKAVQLDPNYASPRSNLGTALFRQGKLDEAVAMYQGAIKADSEHVPSHFNLGLALNEQGKFNEAAAAFRNTIRINPEHYRAQFALGSALREVGDRAGAAQALREYLRLAPDTPANKETIERARGFLKELEGGLL